MSKAKTRKTTKMTKPKNTTKQKTAPKTVLPRIAMGAYVVIATSSRPWTVAAGYYDGEDEQGRVYLNNARQIIFWDRPSKGLFGLAANGIIDKAGRVTPRIERVRVKNEEHVIIATEVARKSIEEEPWT